jgi:hypothetical protein
VQPLFSEQEQLVAADGQLTVVPPAQVVDLLPSASAFIGWARSQAAVKSRHR